MKLEEGMEIQFPNKQRGLVIEVGDNCSRIRILQTKIKEVSNKNMGMIHSEPMKGIISISNNAEVKLIKHKK